MAGRNLSNPVSPKFRDFLHSAKRGLGELPWFTVLKAQEVIIQVSAWVWEVKSWLEPMQHLKPLFKAHRLLYWLTFCNAYLPLQIQLVYNSITKRHREAGVHFILSGYHGVQHGRLMPDTEVSVKFQSLVCGFIPPHSWLLFSIMEVRWQHPNASSVEIQEMVIMMLFSLLWKHLYGTEVQLSMKWCANLQSSQCNLEFIFFSMCMQLWR